jgi:hypothetical protein
MGDALFKQSMAKGSGKAEIVYDYDTSLSPQLVGIGKMSDYYGAVTPSTMPRTRSATYVGGVFESMVTRAERAQTKMVNVHRKPSANFSTSIQINPVKDSIRPGINAGEYY